MACLRSSASSRSSISWKDSVPSRELSTTSDPQKTQPPPIITHLTSPRPNDMAFCPGVRCWGVVCAKSQNERCWGRRPLLLRTAGLAGKVGYDGRRERCGAHVDSSRCGLTARGHTPGGKRANLDIVAPGWQGSASSGWRGSRSRSRARPGKKSRVARCPRSSSNVATSAQHPPPNQQWSVRPGQGGWIQ